MNFIEELRIIVFKLDILESSIKVKHEVETNISALYIIGVKPIHPLSHTIVYV